MYAGKYHAAMQEADRLREELDRLSRQPKAPDERSKAYLEDLKKRADAAEGMGEVLALAIQDSERREGLIRRELAEMERRHHIQVAEVKARMRHADYDEVLTKAGIYQSLASDGQGRFQDPILARLIYGAPDPAEKAYEIAAGKLAADAEAHESAEPEPSRLVAPASPAPAKAEIEAERRGARQVIAKVVEHTTKPKGIRALRSAGQPPTARFTRAQLDALMDRDPAGYERLMARNPDLERFHLG